MEEISSTLVWICQPELPIECFNEELLMRVRDKLGKEIRVDHTTMTQTQKIFARICN